MAIKMKHDFDQKYFTRVFWFDLFFLLPGDERLHSFNFSSTECTNKQSLFYFSKQKQNCVTFVSYRKQIWWNQFNTFLSNFFFLIKKDLTTEVNMSWYYANSINCTYNSDMQWKLSYAPIVPSKQNKLEEAVWSLNSRFHSGFNTFMNRAPYTIQFMMRFRDWQSQK